MKEKALVFIIFSLMLLPMVGGVSTTVFAQNNSEETPPVTNPENETPPVTNPTPEPRGSNEIIVLQNPLKVDSLEKLLLLIVDVLIILATPIIVFFIIYAGFLFVTAQGSEEKLTKAKDALLWTIVGGVILLGAKVILEVIESTIKSIQ